MARTLPRRLARVLYAAMTPLLEHVIYVNDLGADEADRVRAAYGSNYERLLAIKGAASKASSRVAPRCRRGTLRSTPPWSKPP